MPYLIVIGDADDPGVLMLLSQYQPEQGGLAVTVSADKSQAFTGVDQKTDLVEEHLASV